MKKQAAGNEVAEHQILEKKIEIGLGKFGFIESSGQNNSAAVCTSLHFGSQKRFFNKESKI